MQKSVAVADIGKDDRNDGALRRNIGSRNIALMNAMRTRLGMLTPSSNSVLEPVTCAMLAGAPGISAHFSRFRVTEIALDAQALDQFNSSRMLPAADLLADAKVDAMAWNGTSASWLGNRARPQPLRSDQRAHRKACHDVDAGLHRCGTVSGAQRIGFVTPYTDDVQRRIGKVWAGEGVACHAERHLGMRDNFSFGEVTPAEIAAMIRAVAAEGCDAIVILCTNMNGAGITGALERELNVLILNSVAVTLWRTMLLGRADPGILSGWGRVFQFPLP